MAETANEAAMLDEIKKYLASKENNESKKKSANKTVKDSPYFSKNVSKAGQQERSQRKVIGNKKKVKLGLSVDERLDYYTATFEPLKYPKDETTIKDIVAPYYETVASVKEEFKRISEAEIFLEYNPIAIDLSKVDNGNSGQNLVAALKAQAKMEAFALSPETFIKRYPRFCGKANFTQAEISCAKQRSDVWFVRFIEVCYDEVLNECCKAVVATRRRKRCNLYLGGLDAFPLVVERIIARTYSTLDMRRRITVEFLITLNAAMEQEASVDEIAMTDSLRNEMHIVGGRASVFSKCLSEEWDLDHVAILLHFRSHLQVFYNVKLADLVVSRIWDKDGRSIEQSSASSNLGGYINEASNELRGVSSESIAADFEIDHSENDAQYTEEFFTPGQPSKQPPLFNSAQWRLRSSEIAPVKATPVNLPRQCAFVQDLAFPEAPLLAVDIQSLSAMCLTAFPALSVSTRKYICGRPRLPNHFAIPTL